MPDAILDGLHRVPAAVRDLIVPAGVMLGIGIPNLVKGMSRRRAYQAATRPRLSDRLTPAMNRTPHGSWTGGLTLRF